jgi:hypothetical protein
MRKGGLVNHLPQQTLSKTTVPQQDEPDCKHNLLSPLSKTTPRKTFPRKIPHYHLSETTQMICGQTWILKMVTILLTNP